MDQIVAQAMTHYGKNAGLKRKEASVVTMPTRTRTIVYPARVGNLGSIGNVGSVSNGKPTGNGGPTRVPNADAVS